MEIAHPKLRILNGLFTSIFIFVSHICLAQGGNTPCTATALGAVTATTCTYPINGDTGGANNYQSNGANGGIPSCATPGAADVWFSFTAPAGGRVVIDLQTGTITDSGMSLYGGAACNSLTEIECDDDDSPNGAMSMIDRNGLTPGATYYIRVWKYSTGTGTFTMCVTLPPPAPANDECATAVTIVQQAAGSCTVTNGTVAAASNSGIANCTGTADDDVWYSFIATSTNATIRRTTTGSWDSGVELFNATGGGTCIGASIGCQDAETDYSVGGLTIGNRYYVRMYTWSSGYNGSTFTICITTPPPAPANDDCGASVLLTSNAVCTPTSGTVVSALNSGVALGPCFGTADDDVWYRFTATGTQHTITLNTTMDAYMQVFSGACGSLTSINCSDPNVTTLTGLTAGQVYRVRVYSYGSTAMTAPSGDFTICVTHPSPPQCGGYSFPINGMTGLCSTTSALSWTAPVTGDVPTGYKLYFGTNNPPTNIVNGTNLGNILATTQATAASTTYYWRIVPTNSQGDATGCVVQSFTTGATCPTNNMNNTALNACTGLFFDSGGSGGNYGASESFTKTICSNGGAGSSLAINFYQFQTFGGGDNLVIYDGSTTAAPVLGTYSGSNVVGVVYSSGTCLTFVWTSNANNHDIGFGASIGCIIPPPLVACAVGPAPANDACAGAIDLGTLTSPAACPSGIGPNQTFVVGNCNATAESPYRSLLGCLPAGNMATPAADVWYRFTASSSKLDINISGAITTPNVGLWQGTCGSLTGRFCAVGSASTLSATFEPLMPGQVYYLQISGANTTDRGNVYLKLKGSNDCVECLKTSSLVVTPPPPANGNYGANQPVQFCLTVSDWNTTAVNWIHGVSPTFGGGWDLGTLIPVGTPVSCTSGTWLWLNSCTSTYSGNTYGPGWYYDLTTLDGNPGNNLGDACSWPVSKQFCWRITTKIGINCVANADLSMAIDILGDSESGSWSSPGCGSDASPNFLAGSDCTLPIVMANPNIYISAANNGASNNIKWKLDLEKSIDTYTLEKSLDGKVFETLRKFQAPNGIKMIEGEFSDTNIDAKDYYQIKTTSFTGEISYSKIVSTSSMLTIEPKVYPNPSNSTIHVDFSSEETFNCKLEIVDVVGKVVYSKEYDVNDGANQLTTDISSFDKGLYFIKLSSNELVLFNGKVVKQ